MTSLTTYTNSPSGAATTSWAYVPTTGLLSSKTYADGTSDSYSYNDFFQMTGVSRPGVTSAFTYNSIGERDTSTYSWTGHSLAYSITGRDNAGRVTNVSENETDLNTNETQTTTRSFTYNSDNQLTADNQGQAGATVQYAYYDKPGQSGPVGSIKSITLKQGSTALLTLTYLYDTVTKRLQKIQVQGSGGGQQTFTYGYLANTDLISSLNSNGVATRTWSYETDTGRLSQSKTTAGATTLYQGDYGYAPTDQRNTETVSGSAADEHTWEYDYDDYDQLQTVTNSADNSSVYSYAFDGLGNRTDLGAVNNVNEYTEAGEYDARGNLTKWDGKTYQYDGLDRMILAEDSADYSGDYVDGALRATFGDDSDGRRTWKKSFQYDADANEGAGGWTQTQYLKFAYDGTNIVGTFDGNTGNLLQSYAWGQDMGGGIGGLLVILDYSEGTTPTAYFPIYDGSGNIVGLHDATGAVVATYTYDPFGKQLSATGTAADKCPFRWQTRWYDVEGKEEVTPYRPYLPSMGRWMTRDPAGQVDGVDLVYCRNDPINNIDPLGLEEKSPAEWERVVQEGLRLVGAKPAAPIPGPYRYSFTTKTYDELVDAGVPGRFNWGGGNWAAMAAEAGTYMPDANDQLTAIGLDPEKTRVRAVEEHRGIRIPIITDGNSSWYVLGTTVANDDGPILSGVRYFRYETGALQKEFQNLDKVSIIGMAVLEVLLLRPVPVAGLGGVEFGLNSPNTTPASSTGVKAARSAEEALEEARAATERALAKEGATLKTVPNPYGSVGSPAHQAKVAEAVRDIQGRGLTAQTEVPIKTVNGVKVTRVMDVVAVDPRTGRIVEVHQVGRGLKSDPLVPVSRERAALRDVRYSPEIRDAKRVFHNYEE